MNKGIFLIVILIIPLVACQKGDPERDEIDIKARNNKASEINTQLGLSYLNQGDVQRAKRKLLTALEQAPKSPDVNGAVAYYFEKTGEKSKANEFYHKALSFSNNKGPQLNNYGAFLCRQGHYQQAESFFINATKDTHYVNTAGAFENAGLCALAVPNIAKAEFYFKKALEQDPKRQKSMIELMKITFNKKNYKETVKMASQFDYENGPSPISTWFAYQAFMKQGEKNKAQAYATLLQSRFPKSRQYQLYLKHRGAFNDQDKSIG